MGGLALRATVFADLTKENPNAVIVESGNLSDDANKLDLITSVLAGLGYDAVGVGESDLSTGEEFFNRTSQHKLTVLDASEGAPKSTLPYIVKNVDGVKVGVISFGAKPAEADANEYARRKALYSAYGAAREASDILILLDQANLATREWLERNSQRLGAPDVVIGGAARKRALKYEAVGRTHIVETSEKGMHVGVVDVGLWPGQPLRFTFKRITVAPSLGEDPEIAKRVVDFEASVAEAAAQRAPTVVRMPYYRPATCRTCHSKEYDDWSASKHARAIKTLVDEERLIPECLNCHSEIYRRAKAVTVPEDGVGGVDCMTCHSASVPHGMERRESGLSVKVDPKTCIVCHTPDRSAAYEEKSYMARISHRTAAAEPAPSPAPPPAMK